MFFTATESQIHHTFRTSGSEWTCACALTLVSTARARVFTAKYGKYIRKVGTWHHRATVCSEEYLVADTTIHLSLVSFYNDDVHEGSSSTHLAYFWAFQQPAQ